MKTIKCYSTVDLLKIIKQSESYQPEAIKAAKQILSDRKISNLEIERNGKSFFKY